MLVTSAVRSIHAVIHIRTPAAIFKHRYARNRLNLDMCVYAIVETLVVLRHAVVIITPVRNTLVKLRSVNTVIVFLYITSFNIKKKNYLSSILNVAIIQYNNV